MREWVKVFMARSTQDLVPFLKQSELNMAQFGALMRLYYQDKCGVSDIGDQFGITHPAASQLVEKLVQNGLVERTEAAHDRRVRELALTSKGRALVESSLEARLSWTRSLGETIPNDRREAIVQAMTELIAAAQALGQPAH
jgi:DNA-binding MarR family transcriptional regulator